MDTNSIASGSGSFGLKTDQSTNKTLGLFSPAPMTSAMNNSNVLELKPTLDYPVFSGQVIWKTSDTHGAQLDVTDLSFASVPRNIISQAFYSSYRYKRFHHEVSITHNGTPLHFGRLILTAFPTAFIKSDTDNINIYRAIIQKHLEITPNVQSKDSLTIYQGTCDNYYATVDNGTINYTITDDGIDMVHKVCLFVLHPLVISSDTTANTDVTLTVVVKRVFEDADGRIFRLSPTV